MTIKSRAEAFNVNNVTSFHGYDVENGCVTLTNDEYLSIINSEYETVEVCGTTFRAGDVLLAMDETAFDHMKGDYEDQLQTELEDDLFREREGNIEFEVDPDEIGTYFEGEEARENGEDYDDAQSEDWQEGWNDKDVEMAEEE